MGNYSVKSFRELFNFEGRTALEKAYTEYVERRNSEEIEVMPHLQPLVKLTNKLCGIEAESKKELQDLLEDESVTGYAICSTGPDGIGTVCSFVIGSTNTEQEFTDIIGWLPSSKDQSAFYMMTLLDSLCEETGKPSLRATFLNRANVNYNADVMMLRKLLFIPKGGIYMRRANTNVIRPVGQ